MLLFFMPFSPMIVFGSPVPYPDESFSHIIRLYLHLIVWFRNMTCDVLFPFPLINVGATASFVSLKVYFSCSTIVSNFIEVYLFGVLAVLSNRLLYTSYFGSLLGSFPSYPFPHRLEGFLFVPYLPESFSIVSQSLTPSNRSSINMLAGSLLSSLVSVAVLLFLFRFLLCYLLLLFL